MRRIGTNLSFGGQCPLPRTIAGAAPSLVPSLSARAIGYSGTESYEGKPTPLAAPRPQRLRCEAGRARHRMPVERGHPLSINADRAQTHGVALPVHPFDDKADPSPAIKSGVQRHQSACPWRKVKKAEGGGEEGAAVGRDGHPLLDHLIRAQQQGSWDRDSERLRSLQVNREMELRWLLDR